MQKNNKLKEELLDIYSHSVSMKRIGNLYAGLREIIINSNEDLSSIIYMLDEFEGGSARPINFTRVFNLILESLAEDKENAQRLFNYFTNYCRDSYVYYFLCGKFRAFLSNEQKLVLDNYDEEELPFNKSFILGKIKRESMILWKKDFIDKDAVRSKVSAVYPNIDFPENIKGFAGTFLFCFGDIYISKKIADLIDEDNEFEKSINDCFNKFRLSDYGIATKDEKSLNEENRMFFGIFFQLVGRYETKYGVLKIEIPEFGKTEITIVKVN